jgi:hypothetical protein
MFIQSVIVPLKVLIGLPPLASILVKEARHLQSAPLTKVMFALLLAWLDVNKAIEPVRL